MYLSQANLPGKRLYPLVKELAADSIAAEALELCTLGAVSVAVKIPA